MSTDSVQAPPPQSLSALQALSHVLGQPRPPEGMKERVRRNIEWPLAFRRRRVSRRFVLLAILLVPTGALAALAVHQVVQRLLAPKVERKAPPSRKPRVFYRYDSARGHQVYVSSPDQVPPEREETMVEVDPSGVPLNEDLGRQWHETLQREHARLTGKRRRRGRRARKRPPARSKVNKKLTSRTLGHRDRGDLRATAQGGHLSGPARPASGDPHPARPVSSSEMARQVRFYKDILATQRRDTRRALRRWRAFRARWPHSLLKHEVDLQIIDALLRLGSKREARRELRRFLALHPRSPRAAEMRGVLKTLVK